MKFAFIAGLVLGFAGLLSGAHYSPWPNPPRLPSDTSVVANGGRAETFVIRLPADRIAALGSAAAGVRAAPAPAGIAQPEALQGPAVLLEQFKLRDMSGNVIGIAARHWTETGTGPAAAWLLLIPSRGALLLTAPGEAAGAVDAALAAAGRKPGRPWTGDVEVSVAGQDAGSVAGGGGEFEGLTGRYAESWTVTGAGDGGLQGTITLDTITYGSS
jgi:hypothetical protein